MNKLIPKLKNTEYLCNFTNNNLATNPCVEEHLKSYFTNCTLVRKKFLSLNNKKSSGIDGIPNIILKHIPEWMISFFTIIFNNLLNYRLFPSIWKKAKVIAILKKGKDPTDISNYRPISLLSNIGKIFEMLINDAIVEFCNNHNIIPDNQYGFRHKHSTIHAINKLTSDICWALNDKKYVGACLIDLEKAFDSVWLNGLIYKLEIKGFPRHLIQLIHSMINERSFVTFLGNNTSTRSFNIGNGLQQGTINAPILFNIYTTDVLTLFNSLNEDRIQTIAYADDLILYQTDAWPSRI